MEGIEVAPSCLLDTAGARAQRERYRRAGSAARLVSRTRNRLVVDLDVSVELDEVEELIAVERECCPFFALVWDPSERRLQLSVSRASHEPAIDAICEALGLESVRTPLAPD